MQKFSRSVFSHSFLFATELFKKNIVTLTRPERWMVSMNRFRQFYIENGNKLFAYLLRKSGSSHLAADLVQESFTRYLERYRERGDNVKLLFTIARNLFYDDKRRAKHLAQEPAEAFESIGATQEEHYLAREQARLLHAAMARLSDDDRDILSLVSGSDLSYQEVAEIRRCSVANVKVKVHRARQKLKALLEEKAHE